MADEKTLSPRRALVLNTLLSVFIACIVFAVIARLFLLPQMLRQEIAIHELQAQVGALQGEVDAANAKADLVPPPGGVVPAGQAAPATAAGK